MKKLLLSLLVISISFPSFGQDSSRTEKSFYNERLISEFSLDELKNLRVAAIESEDEDLAKIYLRLIHIKYNVLEYVKKDRPRMVSFLNNKMFAIYKNFNNKKEEEIQIKKLKVEAKAQRELIEQTPKSKLSFGFMPLFLIDPHNPDYSGFYSPRPGFGLELNMNHEFTSKISIGGFMDYYFINNDISNGWHGGTYSSSEKLKDHYLALGGILEYEIFNNWGIQVRGGAELLTNYSSREFQGLYGFGINYKVRPSTPSSARQSINLTVFHSHNQTGVDEVVINGTPSGQETFFQDAYIIQLGWNFQFYSIID